MTDPIECLQAGPDCAGPVEYRMPLSGTGRAFPRCELHWDLRLAEQERIERTYHVNTPTPPPGYDWMAAGEDWDEHY